jgi:hypothetical protein
MESQPAAWFMRRRAAATATGAMGTFNSATTFKASHAAAVWPARQAAPSADSRQAASGGTCEDHMQRSKDVLAVLMQ